MPVIFFSIIVGIFGTGLGGFISSLFKLENNRTISSLIAFSGGVMASIVFFELIPEAITLIGALLAILGIIFGIVAVMAVNIIIDRHSDKERSHATLHESYEEFYHEDSFVNNQEALLRSGILMLISIALHVFPEGIAIGAAGSHDPNLGITLAIMIALHNIPEGMSVAAPLISGGLSKGRSIFLSILAGSPSILGAIIGYYVGGVSSRALAIAFAISGGAMLYAVFGELLPQSIYLSKDRIPTITLLVGIIVGLLITTCL